MCDKSKTAELVKMIDNFTESGGGHLEIRTDDSMEGIKVQTYKSTDCAGGNKACRIPTLHKGIDDQEGYKNG